MKSACFVSLFGVLLSASVLAQSRGNLSATTNSSQMAHAATPSLVNLAGAGISRAAGGRSRRRNAKAQTQGGPEQVLYAFQGGNDGEYPGSALIFDSSGNLYGTTQYGGGEACPSGGYSGCGAVFELSPNGNGGWTESILHSFQGGNDGEQPSSSLIFDQAGNLYGTTAEGGGNAACTDGCGTVFKLSPNGSGSWTETILYSFGTNGGTSDGAYPEGVIFDKSGNLYGATASGGVDRCGDDEYPCGTVFELTPSGGGGWIETIIYAFSGQQGGYDPNGALIFDQVGNLYGTTPGGGLYGCGDNECGAVFELSPNGSGRWTETALYSFQGGSDGQNPAAGLTFDKAGNLYGATYQGGAGGYGVIFELIPNGNGGWTEVTLYSFQSPSDGINPSGGLIFDQPGNLYGTAGYGGGGADCGHGAGCGTVFELSPEGNGTWIKTPLYNFQGGSDGMGPSSGLIFDQTGHLYGTTAYGGEGTCSIGDYTGCGTVFEVSRTSFGAFAPPSVNFGNEPISIASTPEIATFENTGNLDLTITSIQITGTDSGDFTEKNSCPSSLPPMGSCNIAVTFTPSAAGNRSAAVSVTDSAPNSPQALPLTGVGTPQDFSLTAAPPTSLTVTPGQAANYSITVSPLNGFNHTVELSCSGNPSSSTCTVTPSSVTGGGTVSLAVVTTGTSAGLTQPAGGPPSNGLFVFWVALSGTLGLALLLRRGNGLSEWRPRMAFGLALLCLLAIGVATPACGGGSGGGGSGGGTPVGTYHPTVTGTFSFGSEKSTHSVEVTLIVAQ
jgi:uncharacterized repeat protein (TIGR03803 family)